MDITGTRRSAGASQGASLVAVVVLIAAAAGAQDYSKVRIERQDLGGGVFMLTGQGGNLAACVGEDGVFLVDDQFAPLAPRILEALAGLSAERLRFVLNTHWHGDHTGGNEEMGRAGAVLVAHDAARARMSVDQFVEAFGRTTPASPAGALPVVTFDRTMTFHWNGQPIRAFHVADAHTDGDVVVHFEGADVVHAGDTFFNGTYPFIDFSSGGTLEGLIAAADEILSLTTEKSRIIPGHGPLAARADLERYRAMLETVRSRLQALFEAGKTADEIIASEPFADLDPQWGQGFIDGEQFVRIAVRSLASVR